MSSAVTSNPLPCLPREQHLSSVHSKPAGLPDVVVNFPFPPLKCLLSSPGSATALYQHHDPTPTIPGGPPLEPPVGWFSPLSQLPAHVFHLPLHPTILVYVILDFSVGSQLANSSLHPLWSNSCCARYKVRNSLGSDYSPNWEDLCHTLFHETSSPREEVRAHAGLSLPWTSTLPGS